MVSRRGSGMRLSFGIPHVLKALGMLKKDRYVSRATFSRELHLGEGSVKTLIAHLKEFGMADSIKSGTHLTGAGEKLASELFGVINSECTLPESPLLDSPSNHAVLLRNHSGGIRAGVEQRDYAIVYGAKSAVTLLYKNDDFVFPAGEKIALGAGEKTRDVLIGMSPQEDDVIIIASSDDEFVSEISAKHSALCTMAAHRS